MKTSPETHDKVPSIPDLRQRIQDVSRTRIRIALMFQFLTGARVSEVCGKYYIETKDFQTSNYGGEPIIIFEVKTAKRGGRKRSIALPLNDKYESWTKEISKYFLNRTLSGKREKVFRFSDRTLQRHGKKIFENFVYPIEAYSTFSDIKNVILRHERDICTHGLRHLRATDLLMNYGFDIIDLTIFMGWTFKTSIGFSPSSIDRYVMGQWSRYIQKLLKAV